MQRRDTPNHPSSPCEDAHGAVAQRAWYYLPGQALPWAMDLEGGLHGLLRPWIAQRGRGEVSALRGAVGTSSPQPSVARTRALDRRRPHSRGQDAGYRLWNVSTMAVFLRRWASLTDMNRSVLASLPT